MNLICVEFFLGPASTHTDMYSYIFLHVLLLVGGFIFDTFHDNPLPKDEGFNVSMSVAVFDNA